MDYKFEVAFSREDVVEAVMRRALELLPHMQGYHVEVDAPYISGVLARLVKDTVPKSEHFAEMVKTSILTSPTAANREA